MQTMTTAKAFSEVKKAAEKIKNDEQQVVGTVSLGDVVRQGDLYLVAIGKADGIPRELIADRQLAPGTSQGSRHILEGEVFLFRAKSPQQVADLVNRLVKGATVQAELIGPMFFTGEGCELTHPEHGNFLLPAGETFAVVYQRALAQEIRRQID